MKYIILFEDNPDLGEDVRASHMPQHLTFLEENRQTIESAGPLREPDGNAAGGLWIVEAGSDAEVKQLVENDPFWPTGLRKSFRILEWKQVFADGVRLV
ncbi:MAG: YciI family protein [Pseudomonadota bacterium]